MFIGAIIVWWKPDSEAPLRKSILAAIFYYLQIPHHPDTKARGGWELSEP